MVEVYTTNLTDLQVELWNVAYVFTLLRASIQCGFLLRLNRNYIVPFRSFLAALDKPHIYAMY